MFIDDTDYCVAGAREVGMHAVRYLDNAQVIHEIEVLLASSLACPGLMITASLSAGSAGRAGGRAGYRCE